MVSVRETAFLAVLVLLSPLATADTFGSGTGNPLPNVTNISIYDITEESTVEQNETGGTLVASGLNSTLKVSQQSTREYRFSFEILNDGDTDWVLEDGDELFHQGLNSSWNVRRVWYNISGDQDYDGGTFSSGTVTWDTANQGTLVAGNTMYAKYIVTAEDPDSTNYSAYFEVNDTSANTGSFDYHKFFVEKLGFLDIGILEPPNDTVVVVNQSFRMNGSITCQEGVCGTVTAEPRYNESSSAETVITNSVDAEPFNTNKSSETCQLGRGDSCYVDFAVNASGAVESYHLLDFTASSSKNIADNDSEDNLVQINTARIINLTWNELDFGQLDPGRKNVSALGNNARKHNITVDSRSSTVEGLWVRMTDLNSSQLDYHIPAENVSFSTTNDIDTEKSLMNSFQLAATNLSPGTILTTYFWIDVPLGIYNGGYSGKIYFKANETS